MKTHDYPIHVSQIINPGFATDDVRRQLIQIVQESLSKAISKCKKTKDEDKSSETDIEKDT